MGKITFYDTETTGLPLWKSPSEDEEQPHIVQLAAIQCDAKTRKVIQSVNLIAKPNGWKIPEEVAKIHGITTEYALEVGIPEQVIVMTLAGLCKESIRVAHNKNFDQRIVRIALKRYFKKAAENWSRKDHECTMQMAKPIMKLLPKNHFGFKSPKLMEAYKHFTGKDLKNAHSAMADTSACMDIYFAMKDKCK